MKINWKIRVKNPIFWIQLVLALITPVLVGLGVQWQDMTTWSTLGNALYRAVSNPVIVVSMLASVWSCINDPTTTGLSDNAHAMQRAEPLKNCNCKGDQ